MADQAGLRQESQALDSKAATESHINFERLYAYRFRDVDQQQRQRVWNEIAKFISERMGAPSRVLDPASGRCEFINAVPAEERWAVDPFDAAEFRDAGVKFLQQDIFEAELPEDYFGGIFLSNILEHLPSQEAVAQLLVKLRGALASDGRIVIMGPNFRYCAKTYFDCADHTLALTHVAIAEHLAAAGFVATEVTKRFLPFSFRGILPPSPALTRRYLHSNFVWPLLGKQFLVIARKAEPGE